MSAEVTVTYDYDANDRLLTETLDALGAADDRHTVYDWDGGDSTMQLGTVVYDTLDDSGEVVEDVEQSYNARGRLTQAAIDSDGNAAVDVLTTYTYSDDGIRVRQVVERAGQAASVTEFVVDHQNATGYAQTIEEHSREGTSPTRQVSYTIGLDEIAQAVKDNPAATAVVSQFLHDGRGSVRQLADAVAELVQAATKDAAAVLKLDYTAYGTAVNYAAETVATALLHNGEFVDPVTGQQYLRARWYDQATGRFNRVDPFAGESGVPQSLHRYLFAHGDPNTHVDPSGNIPVLVLALAGAALGVMLNALFNYSLGQPLFQGWLRAAALGTLLLPLAYHLPLVALGGGLVGLGMSSVVLHRVWSNPASTPGQKIVSTSLFALSGLGVVAALRAAGTNGWLGTRADTSAGATSNRVSPTQVGVRLSHKTLEELLPTSIPDEALLHVTQSSVGSFSQGIAPRTYFFRWVDVKHLRPSQVQAAIGDLAAGGSPRATSVGIVLRPSPSTFVEAGRTNLIPQYINKVAADFDWFIPQILEGGGQ